MSAQKVVYMYAAHVGPPVNSGEKNGLCSGSEQQIDVVSTVGEAVNHLNSTLIAHYKTALGSTLTALRVKVL